MLALEEQEQQGEVSGSAEAVDFARQEGRSQGMVQELEREARNTAAPALGGQASEWGP